MFKKKLQFCWDYKHFLSWQGTKNNNNPTNKQTEKAIKIKKKKKKKKIKIKGDYYSCAVSVVEFVLSGQVRSGQSV